jgi:hypothetical protein
MRKTLGFLLLLWTFCRTAQAQLTLRLEDYAKLPITGSFTGTGNASSLARVNFMRTEPSPQKRLFVNDLNGPLYVFNKDTKSFAPYLNLNGRDSQPGLFDKFTFAAGFANGFVSFQFDPDYSKNGKFYTIHIEDPSVDGSLIPKNKNYLGLKVSDYRPTTSIQTPGAIAREGVLIEWTDSDITNDTFEGTARELLRIQLNTQIHPLGDIIFNPAAHPGDPDWRVMYVGVGDGGSGERQNDIARMNPQRLDTVVGKILRIIPDLKEHTESSKVSANGRYRIPNDNPFVKVDGAKAEVWAYGLRNPHRLVWEGDNLIASSVGLHTWESIYVIQKGANYGYSEREGPELLLPDNSTTKRPDDDMIPIRITDKTTNGMVIPTYPVVAYDHTKGAAIAGGFIYQGQRIPSLRGKFVLGDIFNGKIWYCDFAEMLAAQQSKGQKLAEMHEMVLEWNGQQYSTMAEIVAAGYDSRQKETPGTPPRKAPNRPDIRLHIDDQGELYITSKVDGMIRIVTGAAAGKRGQNAFRDRDE